VAIDHGSLLILPPQATAEVSNLPVAELYLVLEIRNFCLKDNNLPFGRIRSRYIIPRAGSAILWGYPCPTALALIPITGAIRALIVGSSCD